MKKQAILLLLILLCVGCAGKQHITIIDQTGRTIPTPHYMLQSTSDQIQTVSYWAKFKVVQDLDGSTILQPTFMPYTDDYKFSRKKYSHVTLTIEVRNPKRVTYKLVERVTLIGTYKSYAKYNRKVIGLSNRPYRKFTINVPFGIEDLGKIQFGVDLMTIDDFPIMHFGDLNYKLIK